ncbi:MAG: CRISPR system precrRNA processing endoribonuclease RAMP protein Cas6 [Chloroflexi bacterium]|nr:CRISPR system precrRNA processing endoribonuclease RAMP protein Cas6 [Chloroflexota bacterium]
MFVSAIIPLTALNVPDPQPNRFHGRAAHALFLDLVRRADAELADKLHEPRGDKPFTVSAVLPHSLSSAPSPSPGTELRSRRGGGGAGVGVRFTTFEPRLSHVLGDSVLPNLPREIRLGTALFTTGTPITDRALHPWAGTTDAGALVERWFGAGQRIEQRVDLEFASPTAHRQIHRNMLFPQPAALWGGWLRAWNAVAQPTFEEDLIARVEADVAISRYTLRTEVVDFGEYREAGWVGKCGFTIFSDEVALRRVLHLLADFAFYCGTGYKTTQGMGQTRRTSEQ